MRSVRAARLVRLRSSQQRGALGCRRRVRCALRQQVRVLLCNKTLLQSTEHYSSRHRSILQHDLLRLFAKTTRGSTHFASSLPGKRVSDRLFAVYVVYSSHIAVEALT